MDRSVRDRGIYAFGSFRLDATRRELTRDGAPVTLTPTVFDTLLYLIENPDRVVTREELLDAIWPRRLVEDSNITQTIFTLRKALSEEVDGERFIVTAPGRGYRFAAPVRLEVGAPPLGRPLAALSVTAPGGPGQRRRPILAAATLCLLALVAIGLLAVIQPWRVRPAPGATVSTPLRWSEVKRGLDPSRFTMRTLPKRLDKIGDLWKPVIGPGADLLACLERMQRMSRA